MDELVRPWVEYDEDGQLKKDHLGLTKREYFAAAAIQGLLSNHALKGSNDDRVKSALWFADNLLVELKKTQDDK